ncbi:MAG: hypothetical protein KC656_12240 [Myxococcales bacterium]|nr:hypothetical protein [Myxococcales bacterium]MCB9672224.1 hypothetical protein [Alphaproteobacteria bacterium]MCB9694064.1 hypothetical protein [Alphaproteobacteria bacterium]
MDGPTEVLAETRVTLEAPERAVWWERTTPPGDYDNTRACGGPPLGCAELLPYRWERVGAGRRLRRAWTVGTHPLLATDGPKPPDDAVPHMVVVRPADTYVGYASELLGVPFVLTPARLDRGHQTDLREAADCVAVVIYGRRRMGEEVPYVSPHGLWSFLEPADDLPAEAGDVLHWGWQTGILAVDTAPFGVLDATDRVLLAWRGEVEEAALGDLPRFGEVRRLRWPVSPARGAGSP